MVKRMQISLEPVLSLLHVARYGTLATHSTALPGYPFATVLPYVLDAQHRPIICVSALAEHTKNIVANPRVSLSVVKADEDDVHDAPRVTLVCDTRQVELDDGSRERFLRFLPKTAELLALDFKFFRLEPVRIRYIGGVGHMGWLESAQWATLPALPMDAECEFLNQTAPELSPAVKLLGADCFGIDFEVHGMRQRQCFPEAPLTVERFAAVAPRFAAALK